MLNRLLLLVMLGLAVLLVACAAGGSSLPEETPTAPEATAVTAETPVKTPTKIVPTDTVNPETVNNEAMVESIQVLLMESMPVQVAVQIDGNLPDGCTTIASITPEQDGNTFDIRITTQRDTAALCTEALVPFSEQVSLDVLGLPAGTYTVNVTGQTGAVTETFTLAVDNVPVEEETPAPAALDLPAACFPQDAQNAQTGPLINVQDGYCFQYPAVAGFRIHDVRSPGITAVWGPPLTPTFEPIRAGLTVYKQELAGGRSLDEIVAAVLAANPEAQVVNAAATFAGEPAQIVEGIEGMMDSRRYYLIHNDYIFEITLVPLTQPGEFEEAVMAQRESLWETVSDSFTWLPEESIAQFASCPQMDPAGPIPKSPYVNVPQAYCLLYPSHYGQQEIYADGVITFTGPALDPTIPDPLRNIVTINALEPANGRSVGQVVDELVSGYDELDIQQSEQTLDGEPAILVSGLPARSEGRDLFVVHNDLVYHLRMEPLGFPEVADDLQSAWELITSTFQFLQ